MKNLTVLVLALFCLACNAPEKTEDRQMESQHNDVSFSEEKTEEILSHHLEAFKNNDMEAIMEDYTEESVLVTPDATYTGLEEIRTSFVNAFKTLPKASTTFIVDKSIVAQDIAYIVWNAKTPALTISYGTDTFIIRNGKIVRQTFAGIFE